eukprot:TRINITY_DN72814_c0_g1_i1.p1 TRINITY_DN72814_c0_g1~~TRINITY_DN72814_c0_g1_i1.p1  ORF type:complete len:361 (-),score=14.13 TRINITY_DN72814_c0_g1_i1:204-1286(-)
MENETKERVEGVGMNIWMCALLSLVIFHVGIALNSTVFLVLCGFATALGFLLAPSTTAVSCWLLFFTAIIPQLVLMHLGWYGIRGICFVIVYWLWSLRQKRFDPDLRTAEASPIRKSRFWQHLAAYFPAQLHMDVELKDELYMFAVHPHGLWSASVWSNLIPDRPGVTLPRRRICTLDMNFKVPVLRDVLFSMGLIGSSAKSIRRCFSAGISVMLVVGGGREAMHTCPGTFDVVLESRKGFVKLALESGANLVPVLGFGETSCYRRAAGASLWDPLNRFLLRSLGMSLPIVQGWCSTFLPYSCPLVTVIGSPLQVKQVKAPSQEQIDSLHAEYLAAVKALYDKYKDRFDQGRKVDMRFVG